jgi:hypothetical protein
MKAMALMLGKPAEKTASSEEALAKEAFSALQDGDEEGFVSAFLGAMRACAGKSSAGDYEDEEVEDDEE